MSDHSRLPKEQLTAFQRWELNSFDPVQPHVSPELNVATLAAQTADLQLLQKNAYDEGYATGYQESHAAGHQAGYTAGMQQAKTETQRLQTLLQNLQVALTQVDDQLAQSLLDLSLEIARKMTGVALNVNPDIILQVVSSAISNLPHFNQNAHLIVHPTDAEILHKQMGDHLAHAGWKIFSDTQIELGGCRVETAHSHIDATNPARWQCIVESIGQHKSWLIT
jgi:flagellar assembly protein FliH